MMIAAKPSSNPETECTRRSRATGALRFTVDDAWMPPMSVNVNADAFKFEACAEPECSNTSAFSQYTSTTLRSNYRFCTNHMTLDTVLDRVRRTTISRNTVFIFYDMEVTSTNEID